IFPQAYSIKKRMTDEGGRGNGLPGRMTSSFSLPLGSFGLTTFFNRRSKNSAHNSGFRTYSPITLRPIPVNTEVCKSNHLGTMFALVRLAAQCGNTPRTTIYQLVRKSS